MSEGPIHPFSMQDCTICMERLSAPSGYKGPQPAIKPDLVGKLAKCGHIFHLHCLVAMYNNGNKVRGCSPGVLNPQLGDVGGAWCMP